MYILATAATFFVLLCLEILSVLLNRFGTRNISLTFIAQDKAGIATTSAKLRREGIKIFNYSIKEQRTAEGSRYKVTMEIKVRRSQYEQEMTYFIDEFNGVSIESIE